ncbi:unnamed protein product [Plutella xylostella]|uniref:(diamondback moth) hypothetical protein n=1 Tax=Plutella xylostella TaxID=51655 RepID=A0A8S4EVX4_PLUXY|nr:unnamed protein product [Plutella xylostella]
MEAGSTVVEGMFPEYLYSFIEELDEHPWLFSALASMLVGLSGILPLLIIPIDETASFEDGEARMKRTRECKHPLACDASSTRAPLTRAPKTAPDASAASGEASEEASHERLFTLAPRPSPPRSPRHSCESVNGV